MSHADVNRIEQSEGPLPITGMHHVKVPVSGLARSRAWYERVLPLDVELEFRDGDGTVRGVSYQPLGGARLALREDPERAAGLVGWDPIAWGVLTRADLDTVVRRLDELGVDHGSVIEATVGWLLTADGPHGEQVRFYTYERRS